MFETPTRLTEVPEEIKSTGRILVDWEIREYVKRYRMLEPFEERLKRDGVISYGLSSMGYDIRVTDERLISKKYGQQVRKYLEGFSAKEEKGDAKPQMGLF